MKVLCIAAVVLVALSAAPLSETEGIAEFKGQTNLGEGQTLPSRVRVLIGSNACRIETEVDLKNAASRRTVGNPAMQSQARMVMIAKLSEPNNVYMLNDQRRSYAVLDASRTRHSMKDDAIYTAKRLGRDTVAGFSCEKAVVTSPHGSETEVCVTREIRASGAWVDAMNGRNQDSGVFRALHANDLEGFPIRWLIRSGREKLATSFELVRFEKTTVPASAFEIPADYQKTDSMGVWASSEQEKAMHGAQVNALEQMSPEQRKKYKEYLKQQHKDQ